MRRSEEFSRLVAGRLKAAREALGLSQGQLAVRSGVSRPMISHMESGRRNPTLIVVHALATALGVSLAELMDAQTGGRGTDSKP